MEGMTNSANTDQTASLGAVWSVFTLLAQDNLSKYYGKKKKKYSNMIRQNMTGSQTQLPNMDLNDK